MELSKTLVLETENQLQDLKLNLMDKEPLNFEEWNPLTIDTVRGWTWEQKNRGKLSDYLEANRLLFIESIPELINRIAILEESKFSLLSPKIRLDFLWAPIGLGTYGWKYDHSIIKKAITMGIWFIDTAETYGYGKAEVELGKIIQQGSNLLISTKVSRNHMSYTSVLKAAARSRQKLNVPRIDLYQIHWRNPKFPIYETMRAMRNLYENDQIDFVGVSNHSILQLFESQKALGSIPIFSLQVRYNLLDRGIEPILLPFCKKEKIIIFAYSPLGQEFSKIKCCMGFGVLLRLGRKYGVSPAQITLAWLRSKGVIPIPRTNNLAHVGEIAESVDIKLDEEDIKEIENAFPIAS